MQLLLNAVVKLVNTIQSTAKSIFISRREKNANNSKSRPETRTETSSKIRTESRSESRPETSSETSLDQDETYVLNLKNNFARKNPTKYSSRIKNFIKVENFHKIILYSLAALVLLPFVSLIQAAFGALGEEYWQHVLENSLWFYVTVTIKLALGVIIMTVIIGTSLAWIFSRYRFFASRFLQYLVFLPLGVPLYLAGYTYDEFLSYHGLAYDLFAFIGFEDVYLGRYINIRSLPGAIFVMSVSLYPYVYLAARASFASQSQDLLEAAKILGKNPIQIFSQIHFPQAFKAIYTGIVLVVLETLNDVGLTEYFGVKALSNAIFTAWTAEGSFPVAAMLAVVFVVLMIVMLFVGRLIKKNWHKYDINMKSQRKLQKITLKGYRNFFVFGYVIIILFFGFGLPIAVLLDFISVAGFEFNQEFLKAIWHSLSLGAYGTFIIIVIATTIIFAQQFLKAKIHKITFLLTSIGYSMPSAILAIGVLWLLATIHNITGTIAIIGTIYAMLYVYLIRFLPLASNYIAVGFARINPNLQESAIILGVSPFRAMTQIQLPLITKFILFATIIVFVDITKELPATLLLRPFNYETLATYLYNYASVADLERAASAGIVLIAINLVAAIVLCRIIKDD